MTMVKYKNALLTFVFKNDRDAVISIYDNNNDEVFNIKRFVFNHLERNETSEQTLNRFVFMCEKEMNNLSEIQITLLQTKSKTLIESEDIIKHKINEFKTRLPFFLKTDPDYDFLVRKIKYLQLQMVDARGKSLKKFVLV
jgi:hypothetical protein